MSSLSAKHLKRIAVIFGLLMTLTMTSIHFCATGNWLGVIYAHIALSVTDKNSQQVAANLFLVKNLDGVMAQMEDEGWEIAEDRGAHYVLKKGDAYRDIVLMDKLFSGYYMILIGEAYH